MNETTADFIRRHADDDVRQLALKGTKDPDVDLTIALDQIAGRQTARRKLPSWAASDGIIYPPHLSMEQCSSEQTARYMEFENTGEGAATDKRVKWSRQLTKKEAKEITLENVFSRADSWMK